MMKRLSIRWKLTLWYSGVLAVVLTAFGAAIYITMRHNLLQRIDSGLDEELSDVLYEVNRAKEQQGLHGWLVRRFARHEGFDFQITEDDGRRFFVNHRLAEKSLPLPVTGGNSSEPRYRTIQLSDEGRWRIISVQAKGPDHPAGGARPLTVQIARSLDFYDHELGELLLVLLLAGPLTLVVAFSGGFFLARRALAPVDKMTKTVNAVSANRLDQRLEIVNPDDELGRLASTLNGMMERLERSFVEMQRFTADAAHELRTPLTVIRTEAEVALRSPRSSEEYCRVLENTLEETNRLSKMADQLLFLSRQDSGLDQTKHEPVQIDKVLQEVVEQMKVVADEKEIRLTLAENPPFQVFGDYFQLRRLFINLLDNGIKYNSEGGQVSVRSEAAGEWVSISVSDSGIGIPEEHLPKIFRRFYRVDPSRASDDGSTGLGLSLCKSIVEATGGTIIVESVLDRGTEYIVNLPMYVTGDRVLSSEPLPVYTTYNHPRSKSRSA